MTHIKENNLNMGRARLTTSRLTISHSQRLSIGRTLDTGCEWLWSIGSWSNGSYLYL